MKPKKCKICGNTFTPQRPIQGTCSIECAIKHARKLEAKKTDKKVKEMKKWLLTHKDHLKTLQVVFNAYIRERDSNEPCISCGTTKPVKYDAGHYYSVGAYPNVRFDEDNVHKQCSNNCNVHLSGNIHEYRIGLIKRIGQVRFDQLSERARQSTTKLSIPEIEEKIKYYRNLTKIMKKSLDN